MNSDLINLLFHERKYFVGYALSLVRTSQAAEDLVQTVAERLCKPLDEVVENGKAFLHACINNAARNYRSVNRKYIYAKDNELPEPRDHDFESDLIDSLAMKRIRQEAKTLSPKQTEVIEATLDGESVLGGGTRRYESLKTHRRLATLELSRRLK